MNSLCLDLGNLFSNENFSLGGHILALGFIFFIYYKLEDTCLPEHYLSVGVFLPLCFTALKTLAHYRLKKLDKSGSLSV